MKKPLGYTLVELAAATTLLGVVSASTLPRFVDLSEQAQAAMFETLQASILSASRMAHLKQASNGLGPNDAIFVNGTPIMMQHGYPTEDAIGLLLDTSGFDYIPSSGQFHWKHAKTPQCFHDYNPATMTNGRIQAPQVKIVDDGC